MQYAEILSQKIYVNVKWGGSCYCSYLWWEGDDVDEASRETVIVALVFGYDGLQYHYLVFFGT